MLEIYTLNIDRDLKKYNFDMLLNYVSEEKKERILRFHKFEDAQRSLLGDVLARYAICKRAKVKSRDIVFGRNEYGKPLLLGLSGIHFNISHSGNWVVCAVDDNPVGIDVEVLVQIDFSIAEKFFSRYEYYALQNYPEKMKLRYFYSLWTLKESYIKADGKGMSIPLNSFTIVIKNNSIQVCTEKEIINNIFCQFWLDKNSVFAICSQNCDFHNETDFCMKQFIQDINQIL